MTKELELIRLNEANNNLLKAIHFLNGDSKIIVENIINHNKRLIDEYNKKEITIINPTKTELGTIRSSLKIMATRYLVKHSNIKEYKQDFEFSERYENCKCNMNCDLCKKESKESDLYYDKVYKLNKPYSDFLLKIKELCDKTKISKDLISAKILLMRKHQNYFSYNKLETETNEFIKIKMLEQFIEQNKQFVENSKGGSQMET